MGHQPLKQSNATVITLGPFVSEEDAFTSNTNLDVANVTVEIFKQSDIFASASSATITPTVSGGSNDMGHMSKGFYKLELTAAQVDTVGRLRIGAVSTGNVLPVWENFTVIDPNSYEALYSGTGVGTDDKYLISANAVDSTAVAASGANMVADHAIRRTLQNIEASSDGDTLDLDSLYGILARFFKVTTVGNVMTVYKSDGSTVLGTVALTTDVNANAVTGIAAV